MAENGYVYNHDVLGLHRRINRFIEEVSKSTSSGGSQVNAHDQERLFTYIQAIRGYHDWLIGQPLLDLPETHPRKWVLQENPSVPEIENESAIDVVNMLELARDELVNGQSARNASGLTKFDSARLMAVIDKTDKFLSDYIAIVTPLDLPESSPMKEATPPGRTGV